MTHRTFLAVTITVALVNAALGEKFVLLTGVDAQRQPGTARTMVPIPGPGVPGTFFDGDRLAGTSDVGPMIDYQGIGGPPMFEPNEFGALSMKFRRGSIPIGPAGVLPFMGIEFLGGPLLDLDGDLTNGSRSLIPVIGQSPVVIPGSASFIELDFDFGAGAVFLRNADIGGNNEGGQSIGPEIATILVTIAGTGPTGQQSGPINPGIDTRRGSVVSFHGSSGTLTDVYRIQDLGFEFWEDTISQNSSTWAWLGTFQFLGALDGWLVERDPLTGRFPTLAGEGLGSTRWPEVNASQVGNSFNIADPLGGSATIADGAPGDMFTVPGNGGEALSDFGGDLGAYLDGVVVPNLPSAAGRFVYLSAAGFGINNSLDPVYGDTLSYDLVIIAASQRRLFGVGAESTPVRPISIRRIRP